MRDKSDKQYQGFEREQVFVKRRERNPDYGSRDKRYRRVTPLWEYCVRRFHQYWRAEGENRSPPSHYQENNEDGWFFPKLWVTDFAQLPESSRHVRSVVTRDRGPPIDAGGAFPKTKELRRWQLPAGAQICASDATVIYPDGCVETWGEIRRRDHERRKAA